MPVIICIYRLQYTVVYDVLMKYDVIYFHVQIVHTYIIDIKKETFLISITYIRMHNYVQT